MAIFHFLKQKKVLKAGARSLHSVKIWCQNEPMDLFTLPTWGNKPSAGGAFKITIWSEQNDALNYSDAVDFWSGTWCLFLYLININTVLHYACMKNLQYVFHRSFCSLAKAEISLTPLG